MGRSGSGKALPSMLLLLIFLRKQKELPLHAMDYGIIIPGIGACATGILICFLARTINPQHPARPRWIGGILLALGVLIPLMQMTTGMPPRMENIGLALTLFLTGIVCLVWGGRKGHRELGRLGWFFILSASGQWILEPLLPF